MLLNCRKIFLRLKKDKSKEMCFFSKEIKYLGHVSAEKITIDPKKISAVREWSISQNKKYLRNFLGFCSYYQKFVKGFSSLAKPLFA